jgi:cholesterol transport system auxiliary component
MRQALTRRFGFGFAALALLALPGCISVLPETEPDTLYRLATADLRGTGPDEDAATVIVGRLAAPRGLAGDRIAIQREERIAYMAGAAWLSPAPDLLHSVILDAFHSAAPAVAPAAATDGVTARFDLDLQLRHFEAVYDDGEGNAPLTRVGIRARLIDRDTRTMIGARTFDVEPRASENRQGAIVESFSRATSSVARLLAEWTEIQVCSVEEPAAACD